MTVFVLHSYWPWEGSDVLGVFSSYDSAEFFWLRSKACKDGQNHTIEETEFDPEPPP